ncbi:MAG: glycosyltransferase [Proteobacteria bacterium]|nr:glycosyltransferase [Pseudomonadota bacterium]
MSAPAAAPGRPGRVLLCNIRLANRSGTEVVTVDMALGLARRGWKVAVYSPLPGPLAESLAGLVEFAGEVGALTWTPDIIHGHHNPILAAAMARFPKAPALQLCHDAWEWKDAALNLGRVRLHAAVDKACRERFAGELGRAPETIPLLPNAVDLARCVPRGPLPARPARVLIVANRDARHVAAVRAACDRAGLEHKAVGYGVGAPAFALEAEMAQADIVVGGARIALEAMAVGCAALVCDSRGTAGMADSARFDLWRAWNFGHRLMRPPVTEADVMAALAAYDATDAARVSARVRAECGLEPALDRLEVLYHQVLAAEPTIPEPDPDQEALVLSRYLQGWLPLHADTGPFAADLAEWRGRAQRAERRLDDLVAALARQGQTVTFNDG